jgi:hypothetical protein
MLVGVRTGRDLLRHPLLVIREYGWRVFVRACLMALSWRKGHRGQDRSVRAKYLRIFVCARSSLSEASKEDKGYAAMITGFR